MKAIKKTNKASKATSKATEAVKLVWQSVKQVYRAFKAMDLSAYNLQGEATVCALRSGKVAKAEKTENGKAVLLVKGTHGFACLVGVDKGEYWQAGQFCLSLDGLNVVGKFADWGKFGAFIQSEGTEATIDGKLAGIKAIGLDCKYGFGIDKRNRAFRLESRTCNRGKAWFYTLG